MSDVSPTGEQLLEQAGPVLRDTQALIDKALSALKAKTVVEGKLSNARLDEYQLVSYELSLCWAECCAARFMLDHAVACQDEFTSRLCALFCAEAVTATGGLPEIARSQSSTKFCQPWIRFMPPLASVAWAISGFSQGLIEGE